MHYYRRLNIARKMTGILRHYPPESVDKSGWISVFILIGIMKKLNPSIEEVRFIVKEDLKGRFVIDESCEPARIRATQGHTFHLENPILKLVDSSTEIPIAIHATTKEGFEKIKECGELRSMRREYIHFAIEQKHIRSNNNITVFLRLKLQEAQNAGYTFMLSTNGVLLCKGPLPLVFFQEDLTALWKT